MTTSFYCESHTSPLPRSTCAEHVVYRYDPDRVPAITYRSLPHGCTGGANTLDEARKLYRRSMTRLLGMNRDELPHRVEHFEALVAGMWVRDRVGAVHRDPFDDRMFLQRLLSAGPAQDKMWAHVRDLAQRGCNPVVVLAEPGDPLGYLLDQMCATDVLVVVHPDTQRLLGWVALYGSNAVGAEAAMRIMDSPDVRTMPIASLTHGSTDSSDCTVHVPARYLRSAESLAS